MLHLQPAFRRFEHTRYSRRSAGIGPSLACDVWLSAVSYRSAFLRSSGVAAVDPVCARCIARRASDLRKHQARPIHRAGLQAEPLQGFNVPSSVSPRCLSSFSIQWTQALIAADRVDRHQLDAPTRCDAKKSLPAIVQEPCGGRLMRRRGRRNPRANPDVLPLGLPL